MATTSFDKSIVIKEPDAVSKLVDSLLNDKPREINRQLASPSEMARGEKLLEQCLSRSVFSNHNERLRSHVVCL